MFVLDGLLSQKMRPFTLRAFEPLRPTRISGLALISEAQINARTAEQAKRKLSDFIDRRVLERERFYRFEGYAPFSSIHSQFVLNISFYLFEDGRICPLRIWHRSEQASNQTGESDWLVDFNGIPGWSLIASLEPRWYILPTAASDNRWEGRSQRDWYKRACWSLTAQPYAKVGSSCPLKVAC